MKSKLLTALVFAALPMTLMAQSTPDDQVPLSFATSAKPQTLHIGALNSASGTGGVLGRTSNGGVLGIDTVPNWSSYFYLPGYASQGFGFYPQWTWQYTMMGHSPLSNGDQPDWQGHTSRIGAPIVPVTLDLRNYDGSPRYFNGVRMILDPSQYVQPLLQSPIFSSTFYDSSEEPTQFTDAVQRAEFVKKTSDDWHTLLKPRVVTPRTIVLIRGTYRFAVYADNTLAYVLVDSGVFGAALFPPTPTDTTTVLGAAENSGDIQPKDFSSLFFANTFLYNGSPSNCCIVGYHSYDVEPGTAQNGWREKHYVMNYSSWVSPGIFGASFQDITATSHEFAEAFNDPFVNNATPIWLAPNGICQNNLETGDVIEGLPNAVYPISLNGTLYHPQNEALLQWFGSETPSSAIHHAYSYPDTTALTSPSVSLQPDCATPVPFAKN